MDTGKNYIEMCSKAQEIQDSKKYFNDGDHYIKIGLTPQIAFSYSSCEEYANDGYLDAIQKKDSNIIYLPKQDQLQEMIGGTVIEAIGKVNQMILPKPLIAKTVYDEDQEKFVKEWNKLNKNMPMQILTNDIPEPTFEVIESREIKSFEQMWLQLVMLEKYNKQWNFETKEWEVVK